VTLSFLYRAFCRVLHLVRFFCRKDADLAIKFITLPHEVAVLPSQIDLPALQPADRTILSGLAGLLPSQR